MIRQNDQKVRKFILELQKQPVKCISCDHFHVQLRDRLVTKINIPNQKRELMQMPKCSFQDLRTACINYDAVHITDFQNITHFTTPLSYRDLCVITVMRITTH